MSHQLPLALRPEAPPRRRRTGAIVHFHVHGGAPPVDEALAGEEWAKTQDGRLLAYYRAHHRARLTRHDVAELLGCCEVSAGRALSNLAHAGFLRKLLAVRVDGPHGASCHPYELILATAPASTEEASHGQP